MWVLAGSYGDQGGITVFRHDAGALERVGTGDRALQAGYLVHDPATATVYAVDERKTDGRGPVGAPAAVHAFAFDAATGALTHRGHHAVPGPFPTFLDHDAGRGLLYCASHGSFDHVETVVQGPHGWTVDYVYDASTVTAFRLAADGGIAGIADVVVLDGQGQDPNSSPQAGGHAQSSAHAHCATLDPTGRFVVVCDKGTDTIRVYRAGAPLTPAATYRFPPVTAPRHVAFAADGRRLFVTLEMASELAAMAMDPDTGALTLIDRVPTTAGPVGRVNEPAELRLHPDGRTVYVNNRGEDSLAWFAAAAAGRLTRQGHVGLARSVHPGLAARSFAVDPAGGFLILADRPADCLRLYALDPATGAPAETGQAAVAQPAFVLLIPEGTPA